ncbi:unnamed protein product [Discula destructiva]
MSWLGVTPLKKFPAPVCMSIALPPLLARGAPAPAYVFANALTVKPMAPFIAAGTLPNFRSYAADAPNVMVERLTDGAQNSNADWDQVSLLRTASTLHRTPP